MFRQMFSTAAGNDDARMNGLIEEIPEVEGEDESYGDQDDEDELENENDEESKQSPLNLKMRRKSVKKRNKRNTMQ